MDPAKRARKKKKRPCLTKMQALGRETQSQPGMRIAHLQDDARRGLFQQEPRL